MRPAENKFWVLRIQLSIDKVVVFKTRLVILQWECYKNSNTQCD